VKSKKHFSSESSSGIAQKIGCGYALAIGIAILGTTVGLIVGDYHQRRAQQQLLEISRQHNLLDDLENTLLRVRSHPQQLATVLEDSIWFQYETGKLISDVDRAKKLLFQLNAFAKNRPSNLAEETQILQSLLQEQKNTLDAYAQFIKSLWQQIDPAQLTPDRLPEARQQVLAAIAGPEAIQLRVQFEHLSEDLTRISETTEQQYIQANERLKHANTLRLQIILVSMVSSALVAILLAIRTSRAIARPLQNVIEVARRVTQEGNFNLQATVTSQDEIGSLATSLNQLIQWVGDNTQKLHEARQTLEQRVEERTTELTQALHNLKKTQAQLIQTEKMSSLGQMVAGIAHEINNPANFIYGNLDYIEQYLKDLLGLVELYEKSYSKLPLEIEFYIENIELDFLRSDLPKTLESMKMGTERIRALVLSLRNFSRLDESDLKEVDLHEGIDNTLLILNHRIKQNVEVIKKYEELPYVSCYPAQLNQVFMNIIVNALDAIDEIDIKPKQIAIQTEKIDENQVQIKIRDNGAGIPSEIQHKLFDPFFTTKPVGKGTGLGLSIAYQIVEKHRGKIAVISELGKGTEFAIVLPL
jgi:two-component system, NtrC family, sensor kinase